MNSLCDKIAVAGAHEGREALIREAAQSDGFVQEALAFSRARMSIAPTEALSCAEAAATVATEQADARAIAEAYRTCAQILRIQGRHEEALTMLSSASEAGEAAGDPLLAARMRIGSVDSLCWLGRNEQAISVANELIIIFTASHAHADAAKVLVNLGNVHFRVDDMQAALDCYERASQMFETCGDRRTQVAVQINWANILTQQNRLDEALVLYNRARNTLESLGDTALIPTIDANVGYLHFVSGRHDSALASLLKARTAFEAREQTVEVAKCDLDAGDVYRALNLYEEANECYQRSIGVFKLMNVDYELARAQLGSAAALQAMGRTEDAIEALATSDLIFQRHGNLPQRGHVMLRRAHLLAESGMRADAVREAQAALHVFQRFAMNYWSAEARYLVADCLPQNDRSRTRRLAALRRVAHELSNDWLACRVERSLGMHYLDLGKTELALVHLKSAAASLEASRTLIAPEDLHVAFLRDKLAVYEDLVSALLETGKPADIESAFEYVEHSRSRLLLERIQALVDGRLESQSGAGEPERQRLATLRAQLSRCYHSLGVGSMEDSQRATPAIRTDTAEVAKLEHAYRSALRDVELSSIARGSSPMGEVPSTSELRSALGPSEALLEYYTIGDRICAFVLSRDGISVRPCLAHTDEIAELAHRFRYQLQRMSLSGEYVQRHGEQFRSSITRILSRLYDVLVRPLEPVLKADRLIIVPHGVLHGLPFHAFCNGVDHLLDRYEIVYSPSATVWETIPKKPGRSGHTPHIRMNRPLVMGVPEPGIAQVEAEVAQVGSRLPNARMLCGEEATLDAFRELAVRSTVIHLATHALYRRDNPLFSGLRFSDGWLLARDMYDIDLDCDLAVLSACKTGLTSIEPGDELFGLVRGFLSAGAQALAVSLWPADDATTASLMVRFYDHIKAGATPAAALRQAQQAVRSECPHPYHWAAFAIIGKRQASD